MTEPFDALADSYDAWYDSAEGRAIFQAEDACLQLLVPECLGRWLEVGVGTGRFAASLGIAEGVDPSRQMLELAEGRGVKTKQGYAEALPYPDESLDGALLALTPCFVDDGERAIRETFRVLRPNGTVLLGIVPAESPWGMAYQEMAAEGHPVYARAQFRTANEALPLARDAGLELRGAASTLLWQPEEPADSEPRIRSGVVPEAGFVGLLFVKPLSRRARDSVTQDVR